MKGPRFFLLFFCILCAATTASAAPLTAEEAAIDKKMGLFKEERLTADELRALQIKNEKMLLLDARGQRSYEEAHIQGAELAVSEDYLKAEQQFNAGVSTVPPPDADKALQDKMASVPKETPIVTYCNQHCQAGAVLLFKLKKMGFQNVRAMEDGIQVWEAKGYPVLRKTKVVAAQTQDACGADTPCS